MGDNTTVQARPNLGSDGDITKKPPGTELQRKKSHHPELSTLRVGSPRERRGVAVLAMDMGPGEGDSSPGEGDPGRHKMELIHLNRTCTSVDLSPGAQQPTTNPFGATPRPRCSSYANLSDEEKVHRVRHQVSFAHNVMGGGRPESRRSKELASALLAAQAAPGEDSEEEDEAGEETPDNQSCAEEAATDPDEDDSLRFLSNPSNLSPDGDVDYLAVRPSLASTQLNETKGLN